MQECPGNDGDISGDAGSEVDDGFDEEIGDYVTGSKEVLGDGDVMVPCGACPRLIRLGSLMDTSRYGSLCTFLCLKCQVDTGEVNILRTDNSNRKDSAVQVKEGEMSVELCSPAFLSLIRRGIIDKKFRDILSVTSEGVKETLRKRQFPFCQLMTESCGELLHFPRWDDQEPETVLFGVPYSARKIVHTRTMTEERMTWGLFQARLGDVASDERGGYCCLFQDLRRYIDCSDVLGCYLNKDIELLFKLQTVEGLLMQEGSAWYDDNSIEWGKGGKFYLVIEGNVDFITGGSLPVTELPTSTEKHFHHSLTPGNIVFTDSTALLLSRAKSVVILGVFKEYPDRLLVPEDTSTATLVPSTLPDDEVSECSIELKGVSKELDALQIPYHYDKELNYLEISRSFDPKDASYGDFRRKVVVGFCNAESSCSMGDCTSTTGVDACPTRFEEAVCGDNCHYDDLGRRTCRNNVFLHPEDGRKVFVGDAGAMGKGLFAAEDILKGDIIAPYYGRKISQVEILAILKRTKKTYIMQNRECGIDSGIAGNVVRYANHACLEAVNSYSQMIQVRYVMEERPTFLLGKKRNRIHEAVVKRQVLQEQETSGRQLRQRKPTNYSEHDVLLEEHTVIIASKDIMKGEQIFYKYDKCYFETCFCPAKRHEVLAMAGD